MQKVQKEPLSSTDLLPLLKNRKNFIGFFPSDQLNSIFVLIEPVFFIVNVDIAANPGSHWIAVRIGKSTVDIFDSLGFNPNLWNSYPKGFIDFLNRYRNSHKFYVTPTIQPPNTFYCGLYCVYFVIFRQLLSFKNCLARFSDFNTNNQKLGSALIKLFSK